MARNLSQAARRMERAESQAPGGASFGVDSLYGASLRGQWSADELRLLAHRTMVENEADGAAIAFGNDESMACVGSIGSAPPVGTTISREGQRLSAHCLRTGEDILCTDTWTDPRTDPAVSRQQETRSVAIVPFFDSVARGKQMLGLVEIFSSRPNAFGARSLKYLRAVAEILSDAVGTGRAEPEVVEESSGTATVEKPVQDVSERHVIEHEEVSNAAVESSVGVTPPELIEAEEPLMYVSQEESRAPMWTAILAAAALIAILVFIALFPSR